MNSLAKGVELDAADTTLSVELDAATKLEAAVTQAKAKAAEVPAKLQGARGVHGAAVAASVTLTKEIKSVKGSAVKAGAEVASATFKVTAHGGELAASKAATWKAEAGLRGRGGA